MQIREITVGFVSTCCYLLSQENASECIVIDPGASPDRIRKAADGKRISAILLTHGHFDDADGSIAQRLAVPAKQAGVCLSGNGSAA